MKIMGMKLRIVKKIEFTILAGIPPKLKKGRSKKSLNNI